MFPGSDEEAIKLSYNKNRLNTFISCPEKEKLTLIKNKFNTLEKLKKEKLLNIDFEKIRTINELKKKIKIYESRKKDFVIKPIFSRGGEMLF